MELTAVSLEVLCDLVPGKTFQKRSVSSPAANDVVIYVSLLVAADVNTWSGAIFNFVQACTKGAESGV